VTCGSRWFSPSTTVSSTNKTDHHDITEIWLKLALIPITVTYYVLSGLNFNYIHSYSLRARTRLYTINLYSYINAILGELKWEEDIVFSRNKMDIIDGIGKFELNCNGSSTVSPNKIKLIMSWYSFIYV
jgi:hypothetical protein